MHPDVLVGKGIGLRVQEEMEEGRIDGKDTEIFPEEEFFPDMQPHHDDFVGVFDPQGVAAVWLADIDVPFGQMQMVVVFGAQHIISVLDDEIDEEEILFMEFFKVMGALEGDDHDVLGRVAEPLGNEFRSAARGLEVPRKTVELRSQYVQGGEECRVRVRKNHNSLLMLRFATKYINITYCFWQEGAVYLSHHR